MKYKAQFLSLVIAWTLSQTAAQAGWVARRQISDKIFADITGESKSGGSPRRLYGVTKRGVLTPKIVDGPNGTIFTTYFSGAQHSDVYQIWLQSGTWKVRGLGLTKMLDGSRIVGMPCDDSGFVLQYYNGLSTTFQHHADNFKSMGDRPLYQGVISGTPAYWPRSLFQVKDLGKVFEGVPGLGSFELECQEGGVRVSSVTLPSDRKPVIMAYDDLHGDGRKRFYGYGSDQSVLEIENTRSGWEAVRTIHPPIKSTIRTHMITGDGRGDGRRRLYVAYHQELIELEWDGTGFQKHDLQRKGQPGGFTGVTTGLLIGSFRPDGRRRLYLSNGYNLIEFSFVNGRWESVSHPLGIGIIGGLAQGDVDGGENLFLALSDSAGLYALEWVEPPTVTVLPFYARGRDPSEGRIYADLLRTKVLGRGDCRVVERERIDSVLEEQKLHGSMLVDPKSAIRAAQLLKADYIVTGSIGRFFQEQLASISVLSVRDGSLRSADFVQWRDDAELDAILRDIAPKACPQ